MANKKLSILTLPEGSSSTTYDIDALYLGGKDASQYMLKTSGEWNQEINFGSSGLLLIGRFPMYDSGVVVEINATTNTTYHGTLVLATQNVKNNQTGSYKAVVYGDADNTITPSLYIERLSGSNVFSIYFKPASWSKNVVHIQAVSLNTAPTYGTVAPATDICKNIDTLPATATIRPTNALLSNFYTESEVNNLIAPAMVMRGTLGTTGTITALPTASQSTLGDMYKVITAGTYATIAAKVNDTFVCYTTDNSTYNWMLIPSGDDVEDTWRQIKLNGTEILGTGSGTKPLNIIPGSNMTITNNSGSVTFDAADTTYSFASGTNCFTVTPSGGSAQTVGITSDRFFRLDTRSANPSPYATDNYPGYTTVHLKYNNIIGITGEDTYSALMQIYPWGDVSGGAAHQLVYGSKGGIYHRYGTSTWSSWNQLATREWVESLGYIDDVSGYLPLSGSSTTDGSKNMTGPIVFKDVNGIILNSNNKDVKVWSVWGNSGNYAEQYGFHLLYKGTGSGNDNTLHLYAHNETGTKKEVYEIKQNGTTTWKTAIDFTGGITVNSINVSLEGHGHTNMVTGSGLTANNIVVGNGGSTIKISGVSIDTSNNVSIPGKLTVSTGAYISGRAAGGGDDEGLIIGRASNGYAGLILGGATGKRSVLYLMPDTYTALPTKAVWRYNDGTNQSEIAHPGKSGTIALLSDLGSGGDYDVSQVTVTAEDAKSTRYLTFVDAHETKKQSLKVDDDIYYASDNNYNWSSLNVGKSTKNGILTLHRYTGTSDRYVNLQVQNAISTSYTVYMPPAAGTLATQEWVDDNVNSANNSKITISTSGKGLSGSDYFNLNQSSSKTITITLDSSTAGNRTAEKVVIAKADGQINSMKYAITNDGDVVKASWQYNASTECIELMWA